MAVSLQKYGVNHWINHLYYLTPFDNLKSIADHGVLSRMQMRELGVEHHDIADPDVLDKRQDRLVREGGASIHAHVPLYFNPKNPMLSVRRDVQDNIAILCVDPRYVDDPATFIADGNAASTSVPLPNYRASCAKRTSVATLAPLLVLGGTSSPRRRRKRRRGFRLFRYVNSETNH